MTAWAPCGVEPVPVMVNAPVVVSTVPLTWPASDAGFGSPTSLAAASWTLVLDSSWTGSGNVNDDAAPEPACEGLLTWTSALDW